MEVISKISFVVILFLACCEEVTGRALAEPYLETKKVDISSDWTTDVTWHYASSRADLWAPGMDSPVWAAFSEFHSPKYDPQHLPLALTIANASLDDSSIFAQPLLNGPKALPIELVEAAEADLGDVQISESFGRDIAQPVQLFVLSAAGASKMRNKKARLQFELHGMVGAFNRKARIPLNGPLKMVSPDQSIEVELVEGAEPRANLAIKDWQKYHLILIKTVGSPALGRFLRNSIRCYFLVDPESRHGAFLGVARYNHDSSPLATPPELAPGLAGDEWSFKVPEQISLKNKELYIYEFDPDHPFAVTLSAPDFVLNIPSDPSK